MITEMFERSQKKRFVCNLLSMKFHLILEIFHDHVPGSVSPFPDTHKSPQHDNNIHLSTFTTQPKAFLTMVLQFILIQNRQGKTRLAKWYAPYAVSISMFLHFLVLPLNSMLTC